MVPRWCRSRSCRARWRQLVGFQTAMIMGLPSAAFLYLAGPGVVYCGRGALYLLAATLVARLRLTSRRRAPRDDHAEDPLRGVHFIRLPPRHPRVISLDLFAVLLRRRDGTPADLRARPSPHRPWDSACCAPRRPSARWPCRSGSLRHCVAAARRHDDVRAVAGFGVATSSSPLVDALALAAGALRPRALDMVSVVSAAPSSSSTRPTVARPPSAP